MNCDLAREFLPNDQRVDTPSEADVQRMLERMGKIRAETS